MADVELRNVEKRFGPVIAVSDLNLTIRDGEFLVLVGPSGCGKTTALRMIAGLEDPTAGDLFIGGRRVTWVPPHERDIAMVFQNYALYPTMSVYDNVAFGLKMRNVPKREIDRLVTEAAEMLGIGDLLKRRTSELSGGQRQRVALGRAIVRKPQAFLMDEPLSNLDAKLRVQTRAELIKLHQRLGTTTIYVTHDQTEAMTMGHRIAVMREGVLQQLDTPQMLYDHPENRFVAGFIGSPAMNFFPAQVIDSPAGLALQIEDQPLALPVTAAERLAKWRDRPVILGVRPEHIALAGDREADAVKATVEVVEPLGSDAYVTFRIGPTSFVGRFEPRFRPATGDTLALNLDLAEAHFFDTLTEQAIG